MAFQVGNSVLIDSAQGEFPNFSSTYIGLFQSAETTAEKLIVVMGKHSGML